MLFEVKLSLLPHLPYLLLVFLYHDFVHEVIHVDSHLHFLGCRWFVSGSCTFFLVFFFELELWSSLHFYFFTIFFTLILLTFWHCHGSRTCLNFWVRRWRGPTWGTLWPTAPLMQFMHNLGILFLSRWRRILRWWWAVWRMVGFIPLLMSIVSYDFLLFTLVKKVFRTRHLNIEHERCLLPPFSILHLLMIIILLLLLVRRRPLKLSFRTIMYLAIYLFGLP